MEQFYQIRVVGNCRGYNSISSNGTILVVGFLYENYIITRRQGN